MALRTLRIARGLLAGLLLLAVAAAIGSRLTYPFELEWLEGASSVQVARVLGGDPLYAAPSISYVSLGYPPLYYWCAAVVASVTGPGFLALRLVSIAALIATVLGIHFIVRRDAGTLAGVTAAAMFTATYALTDGWFDLGRVDMLQVALITAFWATAVGAHRRAGCIAAGALLGAALLTKQSTAVAMAPFLAWLVLSRRDAAVVIVAVAVLVAGSTLALMHWQSAGWSTYYIVELPRLRMKVSMDPSRLMSFWTSDLLGGRAAPALVMGIVAALGRRDWTTLSLASGCILSSYLARLESGSWTNALIPAFVASAILFGQALDPRARWPESRSVIAAAQLLLLLFDPRPFMPTDERRVRGAAFVRELQGAAAPVLVADHSYYATLAGQPEFAHGWAMTDVLWADPDGAGAPLGEQMQDAIAKGQFATIVMDRRPWWFRQSVEEHYRIEREILAPAPLSGAPHRPELLYVRR